MNIDTIIIAKDFVSIVSTAINSDHTKAIAALF